MARTDLTVQTGTRFSIITPTANAVDAVNGNSYENASGKTFLRVTNGSGGTLTVTITTPEAYDTDLAIPSRTYSIPDGATRVIPPMPTTYNTTDNGNTNRVLIDWSTGTSVTVEVLRIEAAS